jgi:hypothetical protein
VVDCKQVEQANLIGKGNFSQLEGGDQLGLVCSWLKIGLQRAPIAQLFPVSCAS